MLNIKEEDYKKYLKKYENLQESNLPTPCEDTNVPSYVYFAKGKCRQFAFPNHDVMVLDDNIVSAFSNFIYKIVHYAFISKRWVKNKNKMESVVGYQSAGSFEDVVKSLYDYPESFSIPDSYKEDYSKQQLEYINALQKYLLFIGLKDKEYGDKSLKRYRNKYHERYLRAGILHLTNKEIEKILNGEINFEVSGWLSGDPKFKKYKDKERQDLIVDEDFNIRALIEYTYCETKDYKVVKHLYHRGNDITNYKNDDKMLVDYFKVVEKYSV